MHPKEFIMQRILVSLSAFVLLSAGATALHAQESARGRELRHLLSQPVKFNGYDDPKTTFQEVLDIMSKRYNLPFNINEHAFKKAHMSDVGKIEVAQPNPIPEMHTKLATVLKRILERVSPSATYLIRDDVIEITTMKAIRKEFFADRPPGLLPPLIAGNFEKVPLEAALKELSRSGNVVLDSRAAKEATMPVTAELTNVPLDTAVQMLADMAGLKVVSMDNVLYVTSKDNARALMEEQEKLRLQRLHDNKPQTPKPKGKGYDPPVEVVPPKKTKTPDKLGS